jgi:hypothetical protein
MGVPGGRRVHHGALIVLPLRALLLRDPAYACAAFRSQMTRLTEGMSYQRYMELYTVAYNHCTSSRMNAPSDSLGSSGRAGE